MLSSKRGSSSSDPGVSTSRCVCDLVAISVRRFLKWLCVFGGRNGKRESISFFFASVTTLGVWYSGSCFSINLEKILDIDTFEKATSSFKVVLNCSVQGFSRSNLIHLISNHLTGWPSSVFFSVDYHIFKSFRG